MTNKAEYAIQMQTLIAMQGWMPESDPQSHIQAARWNYWHSKYSANAAESLVFAKNLYRLARDMQADPSYYTRRPGGMSCWMWFQRKLQAARQ